MKDFRPLRGLIRDEFSVRSQRDPLGGFRLSMREHEVLSWVAQGKTNAEIGTILSLSPRTVQKHLEHIFQKLGVETRTAAAARFIEAAGGSQVRS